MFTCILCAQVLKVVDKWRNNKFPASGVSAMVYWFYRSLRSQQPKNVRLLIVRHRQERLQLSPEHYNWTIKERKKVARSIFWSISSTSAYEYADSQRKLWLSEAQLIRDKPVVAILSRRRCAYGTKMRLIGVKKSLLQMW